MKEQVIAFFTNPFLITGISSWIIAQITKGIIHAIINRKIDFGRLFGDGGMPSGHSATVISLATITGLECGFGTFQFAMAMIFAVVVCHDAMGVRRETEKQAMVLDELVKVFKSISSETLPEAKLKKFVGHTPFQVFAGGLIGIVNAVIMYFLLCK